MSIIKIVSTDVTTISTPEVGYNKIFADSTNSEHITLMDSNRTLIDLNLGSTKLYSEYEAGGEIYSDGINWIWFKGSVYTNYYISNGVLMTLSVESFIISGSQKITTPTYITIDTGSLSNVYHAWNAPYDQVYSKLTTADINNTFFIISPTEWIEHLDALGEQYGFKFIGFDYRDRIYFQDVDWSIKIRRTFDSNNLLAVDQEYILTYDSITKTTLLEWGVIGGPYYTAVYNPYNNVCQSKFII